jgi:hypothetical protein
MPLVRIIEYDILAARPDTRVLAGNWVTAHIPRRPASRCVAGTARRS